MDGARGVLMHRTGRNVCIRRCADHIDVRPFTARGELFDRNQVFESSSFTQPSGADPWGDPLVRRGVETLSRCISLIASA